MKSQGEGAGEPDGGTWAGWSQDDDDDGDDDDDADDGGGTWAGFHKINFQCFQCFQWPVDRLVTRYSFNVFIVVVIFRQMLLSTLATISKLSMSKLHCRIL